MQDMDIREALQAHVRDGEPPMGLTVAEVRVATRRSRRARAAAVVASAAVAVGLLVAGGSWPWSDGGFARPAGQFRVLPACAVTPGTRPAGAVSEAKPPTEDQLAWAGATLTCHLATMMPTLLPDATYAPVPGAPDGPLIAYPRSGQARVDAGALVRDAAGGVGDLYVSVGVADRATALEAAAQCGNSIGCTGSTGPHGETILLSRTESAPVGGFIDINVHVYRGHTYITVEVSNSDRESVDGRPPVAKRAEPALSADQVLALALAPELYLFP